MEHILKYFPELSGPQRELFSRLKPLYEEWNAKINIISRQDMEYFYIHHVLFSLAIAKLIRFKPGTCIIDIGTGGGFPGVPLAILFPESNFTLLDSIGKKIKVVKAVKEQLNLINIEAFHSRSEDYKGSFDFITGRAVTSLPDFYRQTVHLLQKGNTNSLLNGILYLTGGETLTKGLPEQCIMNEWPLTNWFTENFFSTKKIVHIGSS